MGSMTDDGDLWVFGYGSLMWRPGFAFVERHLATVHGYHRSLCVYSHVHRGTAARPGLVLGLDRGGSCRGVAFKVAAAEREATIAYLREREQLTMVYREVVLRARLDDGRVLNPLVYAVDQSHGQYAGRLPEEEVLRLVRQGVGVSGRNPAYVAATHDHLAQIGVKDAQLAAIAARLGVDEALP
jgi:cation transport protein ChaC